jgi:signal transduction histidine kinase
MTATRMERILVVDDDEAGRYLKAHTLRRRGYTVSEAALGEQALRMVRADPPHLVLLDVKLPDVNGLEVCRQIKAEHPNVAVLQTSAAIVGSGDRTAALEGGADSFLVEPIEAEELGAVVDALLRMRHAEIELRTLNQLLEERVADRTSELAEKNRQLIAESAQRAHAEEALRHAQKLDAIGQLTGGIAHDFNNLLTVVLGNFEMIEHGLRQAKPIAAETVLRLAASGQRAADHCKHLTDQLLAFARRDATRQEVVDVNEIIRGFASFLQRSLGHRSALALALSPDAWSARLDVSHFEAALLNLTINARDAMDVGGTLTISTTNVEITSESAESERVCFPDMIMPGPYLRLTIADTGSGMSSEVLAHVFEPFFTTKDIGKGSGLGLSQVYGFVKQAGGYVAVDTCLGAGTTFTLYLPRCDEGTVEEMASQADIGPVPRGVETILIVDDNIMVLDVVREMIAELGYHVLHATDASEALAILASPVPVDLLFSDVVMPNGISGIELAREARRLRPGLAVLITSGYAAANEVEDVLNGEFLSIAKPYNRGDLALHLRKALGR